MSDPVNELLGRLRDEPLPFSVDWAVYERELWARAARADGQRRRRTTWSFAAVLAMGLLLGALVPLFLHGNPQMPDSATNPDPSARETPRDVPKGGPVETTARGDVALQDPRGPKDQAFTRQFKRADGRLAEIRFEGFTEPDNDAPARLVLAAPGTTRKRAGTR